MIDLIKSLVGSQGMGQTIQMFDAIKAILQAGGVVRFPYKVRAEDWIGDISISLVNGHPYLQGAPFVPLERGGQYLSLDEAVRRFGQAAFAPTNIALAYNGIRTHGFFNGDFDELNPAQLADLVRRWRVEVYPKDYAFAREFDESVDHVRAT